MNTFYLPLSTIFLSLLISCQGSKKHAASPAEVGQQNSDLEADHDEAKVTSSSETETLSTSKKNREGKKKTTQSATTDLSPVKKTAPPPGECKVDWNTIQDPDYISCYQSAEDVLDTIPQSIRPYWVMMRSSESTQEATLEDPRIIINSPDGNFFLSMSSKESEQHKIELAVFNDSLGHWLFSGLDFSGEKAVVEKESCQSCHGATPHPIWTGYRSWPGSFGDNDDLQDDEIAKLSEIRNNPQGIEKHITLQNSYQNMRGQTMRPATRYVESGNNQIMNFSIGRRVNRALVDRIFEEKKPTTEEILPLLYASICTSSQSAFSNFSNELKKLGYDYDDFYSFNRNGQNSRRMWIGFAFIENLLSIPLFQRIMEEDSSFKHENLEIAELLDSPLAKMMTLKTTKEINDHIKNDNSGWYAFDFNWWSPRYLNTLKANNPSCQ